MVARLRVEADWGRHYGLKRGYYGTPPSCDAGASERSLAERSVRNVDRVE